jgi:hypothetical protein
MASIHDESWWESGETSLSAGRTLYWLATIIAAVMVIFAVADFFIGWAQAHRLSESLPSSLPRSCG